MDEMRTIGVLKVTPKRLLKVAGAFVAGVLLSIGCSLIYSSQQNCEPPVIARTAEPRTALEQHLAPAVLNQPSSDNSADIQARRVEPADAQQDAAAGSAKPLASIEHRRAPAVTPPRPVAQRASSAHQLTFEPQLRAELPPTTPQPIATPTQMAAPPPSTQHVFEQPVEPQPNRSNAAASVITLPVGTVLAVRIEDTLSSDRNRIGDLFRGTLSAPLTVGSYVIASTGSTVLGHVANAHRAPLIGGRSDLTLMLTDITTRDGKLTRIDTAGWDHKGTHNNFVNTAKRATGATVGAMVGAVAGAAEGAGISSGLRNNDRANGHAATKRTVVVPAGSELSFILTSPLSITETGQ